MTKKYLISTIIILAFIGIAIFLTRTNAPSNEPVGLPNLGSSPEFILEDYNGRTVSSGDFKGTPMVINSWAAWCPFCVNELKDFALAQEEFGEQIKIIAIDRAESLEIAKKFSDQVGVSDKLIFLLDPKNSFYQSIGGFSMPETIFIDKEGNIRIHKRGPMDIMEIRKKIKMLLGEDK